MPTKGTPKQTIRVDPALWARFGEVVGDRADAIRQYMTWVLRAEGDKLPRSPRPAETMDRTDEGDQAEDPPRSSA